MALLSARTTDPAATAGQHLPQSAAVNLNDQPFEAGNLDLASKMRTGQAIGNKVR